MYVLVQFSVFSRELYNSVRAVVLVAAVLLALLLVVAAV